MPANRFDDPKNMQIVGLSIQPAVYTADQNGTGVDMLGSEGPIHAFLGLGVIDAATTGSVSFEESTDNSTFTAISGATALTFTGSSDTTVQTSVCFERTKRYVRAVADLSGATLSAGLCVIFCGAKKST